MKKALLVVVLLVLAGPALARDNGATSFLPPPPPLPGMSRESQQEIIDRYYRRTAPERYEYRHDQEDDQRDGALDKGKKKKHLPPGLKKKEARGRDLPPGWQKKIARGQVLDRDLRPHCRDLPPDLHRELPPPPRGTRLYQLEDRIIQVVEATFEIIDIFTFGR